jgi:hypothetical protein
MTNDEADALLERLARSHGLGSVSEFVAWLPPEVKEALLLRGEYWLTKAHPAPDSAASVPLPQTMSAR